MSEHTFEHGENGRENGREDGGDDLRSDGGGEDPAGDALMEAVVDVALGVNLARLARLEAVAALDAAGGYRYDGLTSTVAFLVARGGLGVREANREVALARNLPHLPYAVKLVAAGRLTVGQLELLASTRNRHPEPFAADEPTLAEAVGGLTLGDTRRLLAYWAQPHDHAVGGEDDEPSSVFLSKGWKGRGRLDGDLDAEAHDLVATALDTLISEAVRGTPADDLPRMSYLRAQALTELARRHLDSLDTPVDHGNRPHLTVVIDWRTLTGGGLGGVCELGDGTVIAPATARRLACDANVCRLLTGPNSEILDLGRTRRTVSPAQWRALRVRDRHCRFPGCRRPWSWCDAHHLTPWANDGATDLEGLVLLCRSHHTLAHEGGWGIAGRPDHLTVTRPDGTVLSRPPPYFAASPSDPGQVLASRRSGVVAIGHD